MIAEVMKGGPADRAGSQERGLIEEIDGVDTKGMKLREVVDRLRGDEGTDVTDQRPAAEGGEGPDDQDHPRPAPAHRRSRASASTRRATGSSGSTSPIPSATSRSPRSTASTPHELRKLARQMESVGIRALVLDLRGLRSGGSAVHPAVLLADSLLEQRGDRTRPDGTRRNDLSGRRRRPVPRLADRRARRSGTRRAPAEWLAAALQDNHRADIVGSPTLGDPTGPPIRRRSADEPDGRRNTRPSRSRRSPSATADGRSRW